LHTIPDEMETNKGEECLQNAVRTSLLPNNWAPSQGLKNWGPNKNGKKFRTVKISHGNKKLWGWGKQKKHALPSRGTMNKSFSACWEKTELGHGFGRKEGRNKV